MVMEYMAKYIKAGDIIRKGAHNYKVTGVRRENDIIKLIYKTLKTDQFFEKTCTPDEFIKVVEK
jgi:hypothetical protein